MMGKGTSMNLKDETAGLESTAFKNTSYSAMTMQTLQSTAQE